jgi:hypothetical protein
MCSMRTAGSSGNTSSAVEEETAFDAAEMLGMLGVGAEDTVEVRSHSTRRRIITTSFLF